MSKIQLLSKTKFLQVHLFNDKQRHVYGDILPSLCKEQQTLFEEQCRFCINTKQKISELSKKYLALKEQLNSVITKGLSNVSIV